MSPWLRIAVLASTIGGGFAAAAQTLPFLLHPQAADLSHIVIALVAVAGFSFIMVAGLLFAINPRTSGLLLAALAIQLPYLSSSFLTFKFGVGLPIFLVIGAPEDPSKSLYLGFESFFGVDWKIGFGGHPLLRIGLNLVSCLLLVLLWKSTRSAKGSALPQEVDAPTTPATS